jgi:hypothetical protein
MRRAKLRSELFIGSGIVFGDELLIFARQARIERSPSAMTDLPAGARPIGQCEARSVNVPGSGVSF